MPFENFNGLMLLNYDSFVKICENKIMRIQKVNEAENNVPVYTFQKVYLLKHWYLSI